MIKTASDGKLGGQTAFLFVALCTAVYFTSYITRINYGAVITEIINAEGISRGDAGLVSTVAFLTYGAGQLLSGYIGDKVSPKMLVAAGLVLTSVCNLLLPFAIGTLQMTVIWGFNGIFQAFFWPPLVKLMATMLDMQTYKKACVWVSAGSSLGTISVYLVSPAVITLAGWRPVFYISSACAVITAAVWLAASPWGTAPRSAPNTAQDNTTSYTTADETQPQAESAKKLGAGTGVISLITMLAVVIALQGILRDGLTTWMPTFVADTFGFSTATSIFTGIILPIFSVICYNIATLVDTKLKSELKSASVLFGAGAAAAGLLIFFHSSAHAAIVLMAVITGCMHGVNLMLISRVPAYFKRFGRISTVSGLLNTFTYIGSGISGFGIAVLSEKLGWGATVLSWFIVAVFGSLLCVLCIFKWKKFIGSDKNA